MATYHQLQDLQSHVPMPVIVQQEQHSFSIVTEIFQGEIRDL
jgi:hypothetical protein